MVSASARSRAAGGAGDRWATRPAGPAAVTDGLDSPYLAERGAHYWILTVKGNQHSTRRLALLGVTRVDFAGACECHEHRRYGGESVGRHARY